MNLQHIIAKFYRESVSKVKYIIRHGGINSIRARDKGRLEMEQKAKEIVFPNEQRILLDIPVNFLTGKNYWYLTAFCIYSLLKCSTTYTFKFRILNDGSFNEEIREYFLTRIPNVTIVELSDVESKLEIFLPKKDFPHIRGLREKFVLLKKLTDVHLCQSGFNIYLDSDIVFYNEPLELIEWAKKPEGSFIIEDCIQSYGIEFELMKRVVANNNIPLKLNSGVYGIDSSKFDFNLIEQWIEKTANPKGLGNYYWEQALTAMLVSLDRYYIAPSSRYIVLPSKQQILEQTGVLQHYVDTSQKLYFTYVWKSLIS